MNFSLICYRVQRRSTGYVCLLNCLFQLEKSLRKLEESLRKYDRQYHEACMQEEQARQEWDSTIYKVHPLVSVLYSQLLSTLMEPIMNKLMFRTVLSMQSSIMMYQITDIPNIVPPFFI